MEEIIVSPTCNTSKAAYSRLNSLREARSNIPPEDVGKQYVQVAEFLSDFHSPVEEGPYTWELDTEYRDYQWWLARLKDGPWKIVSWGY